MNVRPARGTRRAGGPKPTPRQRRGELSAAYDSGGTDDAVVSTIPAGCTEYLKRYMKEGGILPSGSSKSGLRSSGVKPKLAWPKRLTARSEPTFTDEAERFLLELGVLEYHPNAGRVYLSDSALRALPGSVLADRPPDTIAGRYGEWARAMAEAIMAAFITV